MSEDKNQQKTGKQLLNDTQEAAERAHLLREMNPTSAQLETELKHEKRKHSYNRALRSTLYTLLVVAAVLYALEAGGPRLLDVPLAAWVAGLGGLWAIVAALPRR